MINKVLKKISFITFMLCVCICLTACNDKKIYMEIEEENESTIMIPKGISEEEYDMFFTEYDDKFIWTVGETSLVYYHDGENVTAYETYIKFNDEKTANEFYKLNKDTIKNEENGVIDFKKNKNYIIINYSLDECEYKTYDDLKMVYELFKELKN